MNYVIKVLFGILMYEKSLKRSYGEKSLNG